jgi:hypothetical protein
VVCKDDAPTRTFDLSDKPNIEICGVGYSSHIRAAPVASDSEYGVIIFFGGENAYIHDIRVDGNRSNQGTITDAIDGANFVQVGGNSIVHNIWSVNSAGDGVEMFGDDVVVSNSIFRNNEEQDIHFWGSNSVAEGNLCINCQEDGAIRVYTADVKRGDADNIQIKNNTVVNPATYGIGIQQENAVTTNAVIEGNTVVGAGLEGIRAVTATKPVVRDNQIVNPTDDGILIDSGAGARSTNPRIYNNEIRGADRGIDIANINDPWIEQNSVENCQKDGIRYTSGQSGTYTRIKNNNIKDNNQENGVYRGIVVYAGDGDFGRVVIKDNEILSTTTPYHQKGIRLNHGSNGSISAANIENNTVRNTNQDEIKTASNVTFDVVSQNTPTMFLSETPTAEEGNEYYDDGTNTDSGTPGKRVYLNGGWVDVYTA